MMDFVDDEMLRGYLDGYERDSLTPGANASAAYRHGFENGRDDLLNRSRYPAQVLRNQAADIRLKMQISSGLPPAT